jgi:hypothetical protein
MLLQYSSRFQQLQRHVAFKVRGDLITALYETSYNCSKCPQPPRLLLHGLARSKQQFTYCPLKDFEVFSYVSGSHKLRSRCLSQYATHQWTKRAQVRRSRRPSYWTTTTNPTTVVTLISVRSNLEASHRADRPTSAVKTGTFFFTELRW